jgi:aspartate/tyrosine/aromatic aminotransferase
MLLIFKMPVSTLNQFVPLNLAMEQQNYFSSLPDEFHDNMPGLRLLFNSDKMEFKIDGSVGVFKGVNCETDLPVNVSEAKNIISSSHSDHNYYLTIGLSEFVMCSFCCS